VDVATGEAAASTDPRTECDPATTGNEQRERKARRRRRRRRRRRIRFSIVS